MRRYRLGALSMILVGGSLLGPGSAAAQRPRFLVGTPIPIAAGDPGPQAVALGDVNNDGQTDIVVVSIDEDDGPLAVLLNKGEGVFSSPRFVSDPESTLSDPVAIALADLGSVVGGRDGNLDIVVIDRDFGFAVEYGDGAGGFTLLSVDEVVGLDEPVAVALADFDGQNGVDIAIADREGGGANGEVFFFCNAGVGFEPCISARLDSRGSHPIDIAAGDFNGDGRMDAVVLNQGDGPGEGNVAMFVGQGDGRFSVPAQQSFPIANQPRDFVVANVNPLDDAIDDVVVAEYEVLSDDNVTILLGGTSGAIFTRGPKALLEVGTTAIAVGQFTNDDNPDLTGGNDPAQVGSSIIAIAVGDGTGAFRDPQIGSLLPGGARALASGRLNADDLDDLVALNLEASQVRIALNNFDPATPTLTSTPTEVPTRTPTPTPSATAPVATPTGTEVIAPSPTGTRAPSPTAVVADDDSCSIAPHDARTRGASWIPLLVAAVGFWRRRRAKE